VRTPRDAAEILSSIRNQRRRMSLTQQSLADEAGVSVGMVRDLEQGRTMHATARSLDRIAGVLQLDGAVLARPDEHRDAGTAVPPWPDAVTNMSSGLRIQILGPLAASMRGAEVALGGEKHRTMLALLALRANSWVQCDLIIDVLWGDNPPASAAPLVHTYATRLAHLLGDPKAGRPEEQPGQGRPIVRNGACYRLYATGDVLDALVAERFAARAQEAVSDGDMVAGCALYEQSLALWHAGPLCDVPALERNALRDALSRRWTSSVAEFAEACFVNGWYERCLLLLQEVAQYNSLDERIQADLMTALAGMGRQAEALAVHHEVARRLDEEFGISPSRVMLMTLHQIQHRDIPSRQRSENTWLGASSRSQLRQRCLSTR